MRGTFSRDRATITAGEYGGTSLLFTSASFGMILSVSHTFSEEGEREEKEKLKMAAQGINEEEENEEN